MRQVGSGTLRSEGAALGEAVPDTFDGNGAPLGPTSESWPRVNGSDRHGYILRRLFVLSDLVALFCAGVLTEAVAALAGRSIPYADVTLFLIFLPLWVPTAIVFRAYHAHAAGRGLASTVGDEVGAIFRVATVWSWFLLLARAAVEPAVVELLPSVVLWMITIPAVLATRSLTRALATRRGSYRQRALVVGGATDRARIVTRIERHPEWGIDIVQELDPFADPSVNGESGAVLVDIAQRLRASRVMFASAPERLDARTSLSRRLMEAGIQVDLVPADSEILRSNAELNHLEGLPILSMPPAHAPRSLTALKRCLDLLIGVPMLLVASPLIAYCVLRIKLESSGPAFFRQARAGRNGRHFEFLKLRTMCADAEQRLAEVADLNKHGGGLHHGAFKAVEDPRVTKVGAWMRWRSLDELPQLWNVVKGDMSLVGPRPLPLLEDSRIGGHYEVRREVRPGMTGPWQVLGRSDIPFDDMLKLDYSYVMNWSLTEDLRLLVHTLGAVIRPRGAY
jgi:exopolysaccharide biosynthesis polyprenyl glycosylphosphotransferase